MFASSGAGWDSGTIYGLRVIWRNDGTFHGWYAADDGVLADPTATGLGYASSTDGITWSRGGSNPVLQGTVSPEQWISDPVFAMEDPGLKMRVYFYYDNFSVSPAAREHQESSLTINLPVPHLTMAPPRTT